MDDERFAAFKRVLEYYQADPGYRSHIDEDPAGAVKLLGLPGSDGTDILEAVKAIVTGNAGKYKDHPYAGGYLQRIQTVIRNTAGLASSDRYKSNEALCCVTRSLNRSRMESDLFRRHSQIRYFPLAFELSEGCRVHCSFCGLNAGSWKRDFPYAGSRDLWISLLEASHDFLGDITDQAPLYFATEPLDHPDYQAFLKDEEKLFSHIPQTTTAVPERDIGKTRKLMAFLGRERLEKEARLRFSIRTLSQFRRVMEAFSDKELAGVELLLNNPESINGISLSGRVLSSGSYGNRVPVRYSISCLSGVLVRLCARTISFVEPVTPDDQHREGIRILETLTFGDMDDYVTGLNSLFQKYGKSFQSAGLMLSLNHEVRVMERKDDLIIAGRGAGYVLKRNLYTMEMVRRLHEAKDGISFESLKKDLVSGREMEEEFARMIDTLFQKGYITTV